VKNVFAWFWGVARGVSNAAHQVAGLTLCDVDHPVSNTVYTWPNWTLSYGNMIKHSYLTFSLLFSSWAQKQSEERYVFYRRTRGAARVAHVVSNVAVNVLNMSDVCVELTNTLFSLKCSFFIFFVLMFTIFLFKVLVRFQFWFSDF